MFESRGKMGPKHVTGENAAALAKRARMVQRYGLDKARSRHDWPALKRALSHKRKVRDDAGKPMLKLRLADLVAEGVSLSKSAPMLNISKSYASKLWREIVSEMGWQAV